VRVLHAFFCSLCARVAPPPLCQHCCFFGTEKKKEQEGKDGEENALQKLGACVAALFDKSNVQQS
jgi:hypothetical protein